MRNLNVDHNSEERERESDAGRTDGRTTGSLRSRPRRNASSIPRARAAVLRFVVCEGSGAAGAGAGGFLESRLFNTHAHAKAKAMMDAKRGKKEDMCEREGWKELSIGLLSLT